MKIFDIKLFTKDGGLFYLNVFIMSVYLLFYGSTVLSITPIKGLYEIASYAIVAIIVIFALIYLFDKILIKKRFSNVDVMVGLFTLFAFYSALCANAAFNQPILKGIIVAGKTYLPLISIYLVYYLIKTRTVTLLQYNYATVIMVWVNLLLYIYLMYTINPALYKDTELVGYNPSKGGYVFNFPPGFIIYGLAYYFLDYTLNRNKFSLLLSFGLIAYILFLDKGRILFLTVIGAIGLHTLWILPFKSLIRRLFVILVMVGIMLLVVWLFDPELLDIVVNMFGIFIEAIFGIETGEGSADSRWLQIGTIISFLDKHPQYWIFGVGFIPKDDLYYQVGYINFLDVGIVGVVFVFGIVGTVLNMLFFLYPVFVIRKIKNFKYDLIFNTAIVGVIYQILNAAFTGGFAFAPIAVLNTFMILEYYKNLDKRVEHAKRLKYIQDQKPAATDS